LLLYSANARPIVGKRMIRKNVTIYFRLFRIAASHYMKKKILPYLKLPGIVEMDETYIGRRKFAYKDPFPRIRWVFGMHCRLTRLSVMYFIKDKVHATVAPLIKAHL
jgi:hypothetical protein